jgi:hypothetical protein
MAKKFGEPGENLVQGAGRFGGSTGAGRSMGSGSDSRADITKLNQEYKDYMSGLRKERGMKGTNPIEPKTAEPLTKEQMRARDRANAEVQKRLPRAPRSRGALLDDVAEELPFKKGGSVSSASKRADGCAIRGKTRA